MDTEFYSMSVDWSVEDNAYLARSPEWPGLSAFGATRQEAITEAEIALTGMYSVAIEHGMAIPEPKATRGKRTVKQLKTKG